jgi:hypothetical protein
MVRRDLWLPSSIEICHWLGAAARIAIASMSARAK